MYNAPHLINFVEFIDMFGKMVNGEKSKNKIIC